jgi:NADP-dependent 3-hydroxy acid dehydrogenase YdfG
VKPVEQQTVLVTGATAGIGEEIARELAARAARRSATRRPRTRKPAAGSWC